MAKSALYSAVEAERDRLRATATELWEQPELGLQEQQAAARFEETLREAGFAVETGIGGMPTALTATAGEGTPNIGLLAEYDALPGLSQGVTAERAPVEAGDPGHGCGHNLLGTASLGAALGLKDRLDAGEIEGTVRFYGCPAEETLVGKVFMARAGAFDDLDAALSWHPSDITRPRYESSLALNSIEYTFHGIPAHAAQGPAAGRSALDAVQLLNTGVEYLREHMPEHARLHYVITKGGKAPNVVPTEASVWYYVRAPDRVQVERLTDRVDKVAEGAATMTGTELDRRFITGCWQFLPNRTITDLMWTNLQDLGPIDFTAEDREFAAALRETLDPDAIEDRLSRLEPDVREMIREHSLAAEPIGPAEEAGLMLGSTEVSDVSWLTPTGEFLGACWPVGTTAHTWQAVAASGDFGRKTAVYIAKALAGTAYDLFAEPDGVAAAQDEFESAKAGREYETPLPAEAEPPFDVGIE